MIPTKGPFIVVAQFLNGVGAHVPIRMDGNHIALKGSLAGDYPILDSTAWGNLFVGPVGHNIFVCSHLPMIERCGINWSSHATERVCDSTVDCGIKIEGACKDVCVEDALGFLVCPDPDGTMYTETITASLDKDGFLSMYKDCQLPP
jgi:hypothetical protein